VQPCQLSPGSSLLEDYRLIGMVQLKGLTCDEHQTILKQDPLGLPITRRYRMNTMTRPRCCLLFGQSESHLSRKEDADEQVACRSTFPRSDRACRRSLERVPLIPKMLHKSTFKANLQLPPTHWKFPVSHRWQRQADYRLDRCCTVY
jgi:hypothetical protein